MAARCVDAVSEQHDRFAAGNRRELFLENVFDGVVKPRTTAGARAFDRAGNFVAVGGRLALHRDPIVKGHDHHAVIRFQFGDKGDRGVLDFVEAKMGGAAGVDEQDDGERRVSGGEIGDLLIDAVFLDAELFAAQERHVPAAAIEHRHRNHHEGGIRANHVTFDGFALGIDARRVYVSRTRLSICLCICFCICFFLGLRFGCLVTSGLGLQSQRTQQHPDDDQKEQ